MDRLINKIRELRFRNGELTQEETAERVGVGRQTINAIEIERQHEPIEKEAERQINLADLRNIIGT